MSAPKVIKTMQFPTPTAAKQYLAQMGAQYRKIDELTGKPLYKTPAGIVFRPSSPQALEVLANCVC
jgi:hypothetical protein